MALWLGSVNRPPCPWISNQLGSQALWENMELVSIIMPAFNSAEHIQEAINSVLVQTYVSWELIVINDGSTDHTASVVEAFDDPRIILESRPNLGVSVARNRGLELAKGDWVAFLDADDIWAPFKLEHQMARLSGEKVRPGLIYSDYLEFNEKGSWPAKPLKNFPHFRREGMIFDQLIQHNFIGTLSVLADKQSVLEVGGFDTNLKGPEDWDLWIKISEKKTLLFVEEPLALYRQNPAGLSKDYLNYERELEKVYQRHLLKRGTAEQIRFGRWLFYRHMAHGFARQGRHQMAVDRLESAFEQRFLAWQNLASLAYLIKKRLGF